MEKKWQRALAHLERVVLDCRGHGVNLAVVLIPDEFQVNPAVLARPVEDSGEPRKPTSLAATATARLSRGAWRAVP